MRIPSLTGEWISNLVQSIDGELRPGVCPKCWIARLGEAALGHYNETYIWETPEGKVWGWDIEAASRVVAGRRDTMIDWRSLEVMLPQLSIDPNHVACLFQMAQAGDPGVLQPLLIVDADQTVPGLGGHVLINGLHRAGLSVAIQKNWPAAILTQGEVDASLVVRGRPVEEGHVEMDRFMKSRLIQVVTERGGCDREGVARALGDLTFRGLTLAWSQMLLAGIPIEEIDSVARILVSRDAARLAESL